jgi:hypothetical protein
VKKKKKKDYPLTNIIFHPITGKQITHIPIGLACINCLYCLDDCSSLPFDTYVVVQTFTDGIKEVVCLNRIDKDVTN